MSFRIEEKFYIKEENLLEFKDFIFKKSAEKLYKPRKIESLYFDNINMDMYSDSIEGLVPRKKIRIRRYPNNTDENYYLEIKNSAIEGRFKTRKIIQKEKFYELKKNGYLDSEYGICFPNYFVSYDREYIKFEDIRLSIDTNLVYKNFKNNNHSLDKRIIVEIKTSINKSQDSLMQIFPYQRIRFSKYCFAVEALQ
jgi:SPX domain protein involved in polyphosphate accumulation